MSKENVSLNVSYEGKNQQELATGIEQAVERALRGKTGLKVSDVAFKGDLSYTVTVKFPEKVGVYAGKGSSVDDALNAALMLQKEAETPVFEASVERVAEVPYFTIPIHVRSLSPEDAELYRRDEVDQLANTYGRRLNLTPQSIEYTVMKTKMDLKDDNKLPQTSKIKDKVILAEGASFISFDDADKVAAVDEKNEKRRKSTIYEIKAQMIIYGQAEAEGTVLVGAPVVITKRSPRAASPAAADPVYLSGNADLM